MKNKRKSPIKKREVLQPCYYLVACTKDQLLRRSITALLLLGGMYQGPIIKKKKKKEVL
jgi:hypothetical protein